MFPIIPLYLPKVKSYVLQVTFEIDMEKYFFATVNSSETPPLSKAHHKEFTSSETFEETLSANYENTLILRLISFHIILFIQAPEYILFIKQFTFIIVYNTYIRESLQLV